MKINKELIAEMTPGGWLFFRDIPENQYVVSEILQNHPKSFFAFKNGENQFNPKNDLDSGSLEIAEFIGWLIYDKNNKAGSKFEEQYRQLITYFRHLIPGFRCFALTEGVQSRIIDYVINGKRIAYSDLEYNQKLVIHYIGKLLRFIRKKDSKAHGEGLYRTDNELVFIFENYENAHYFTASKFLIKHLSRFFTGAKFVAIVSQDFPEEYLT